MRIDIDARLINQTGVGVYIRNLLDNLQALETKDLEFHVYVRSRDKVVIADSRFQLHVANYQWHTFAEQIGFLQQLNQDNLDLMHFTYFSYPLLYRHPFVITIHDLTPLLHATGQASTHHPLIYGIKRRVAAHLIKSAISRARTVIVPSQSVKAQIVKRYGKNYQDKIVVTYEGLNEKLITAKENTALVKQFPRPFYLYVGNFYPHKNVERLIRTVSSKDLALVGPNDFFASRTKNLIKKLGLEKRIFMLHNRSFQDLVFLYKHASALIHPSLAEGFGLPLLEAAHFDCPVIASDIPVFKEILGNNYLAFNPRDIDDMAAKIRLFEKHGGQKAVLSEKFSFKKMAEQTLAIYQS